MTLYLKYRPQTIDELDLESARTRLKSILFESKDLPHAFLFSGPKGTGKTSSARILAKVLNCEKNKKLSEPCNKCDQCISITKGQNIDVIELDAASNRGIDDIRQLKENIALSPNSADKKIYIIDEAHMLTTEAANAFLKTLEEPPNHAFFILATTDPQKLPETVTSRLATVEFRKANESEIARQLKRVAKGETLKLEKGVVEIISQYADGSFRDAVKLLESLPAKKGKVLLKDAEEIIKQSSLYKTEKLLNFILSEKHDKALSEVGELSKAGASSKLVIDRLIQELRNKLFKKNSNHSQLILIIEHLFRAKSQLSSTPIDKLPLELAILKLKEKGKTSTKIEPKILKKKHQNGKNSDDEFDLNIWSKILNNAREKNASIEALLRAATPLSFDGQKLNIGVYYRFHKERLEVSQNKITLEEIITKVIGNPVKVRYSLTERGKKPKKEDPPLSETEDEDIIKAAEEIFS